jgi:GT2 family glycosyltransferase
MTPVRIDIIMLSYAATDALREMTRNSLESLAQSEAPDRIQFNIVVLESNKTLKPWQYPGTSTFYPEVKFGYNRFLNIGVRRTSNPFVCLCNNDLIFHRNWADEILKAAAQNPDVLSFSPIDPWLHKQYGLAHEGKIIRGYEKMKHVTGWCFVVKREIFEIIGPFDEKLEFWYVDDDYIKTLLLRKVPHALVTGSKVDHLSGKTIGSEPLASSRARLTSAQWLYYDYKWNHHSALIYSAKKLRLALRSCLRFARPDAKPNRAS